jgi:AGCS family alanine or glycine:cation symporter
MSHSISDAIQFAANAIWSAPTIALLFLGGVYLSLRYRFIQVRRFHDAWKSILMTRGAGARGVLTPFQAFATALASSVGTGSIAGVATAIVSGGPGAVFWIWAYGFVACAIKFTEAVLGMTFRVWEPDHTLRTGPMYYLRDGIRMPFMASLYAFVAGFAALLSTPFTQPNSVAVVFESQFHFPRLATGVVIAAATWIVIIGGIRVIGRTLEKLAPLKVLLYLVCGLVVIVSHADRLGFAFTSIVRDSFGFKSVTGGMFGVSVLHTMRYGFARGIYANEAGYGTAAVAYGTAQSKDPVDQGLSAIAEVFIISAITSSVTAFAILTSGVLQSGLTSAALVARAFETTLPGGGWLLALCTFLFAYTTLIGWAYYGEQFFEYILGSKISVPYRWTYCVLIVLGATSKVETVWAWGDLLNGLQTFPNFLGILGLAGLVAQKVRDNEAQSNPPADTS